MAGQGKGNTSGGHRSRHDWVDFAKGFCIVAVVTMWVVGEMQGYVNRGEAGWLGYFAVFAKPFRMPDFFLISGLFILLAARVRVGVSRELSIARNSSSGNVGLV